MAIAHQEIDFELSGGVANTDPLLSFGGPKSGTSIHEFQSTLTADQPPDRSLFVDSSRIGDGDGAHNNKFVLFVGGAANLSAHRIIGFRSSDGLFTLEGRTAAQALSGEFYRVFEIDSLWHELTAQECAAGHTDYRLLYVQNDSVNNGTSVSFYCYRLIPATGWANSTFELAAGRTPSIPHGTPPNHEVGPTLTDLFQFTLPEAFDDIERQPRSGSPVDLANGQYRACWLKRISSANARRNAYVVLLLVHEFTDDAAAQIRTGCLLPFGQIGFTPEIALSPDRGPVPNEAQVNQPYDSAIYVGGGARYTAEVKAQETGLVVPEMEVGWVETGDGSLFVPDTSLTDANGLASVTYHAPLPGVLAQETIAHDVGALPTQDATTLNDKSELAWTDTVDAGDDRILLVWIASAADDEAESNLAPYGLPLSVTTNGVEMVLASGAGLASAHLSLWYLLSPTVGANAIVATMRGVAENVGGISIVATGVDLANPFDAPSIVTPENDGTDATFSHSITTVTDNALLLDNVLTIYPNAVVGGGLGGGQVLIGPWITGAAPIEGWTSLSKKAAPTAGLQTMSRTPLTTAGQDRIGIIAALRPALASATITARA